MASETPTIKLVAPTLPPGHYYEVEEAKSGWVKVAVMEANTERGTAGLRPPRRVMGREASAQSTLAWGTLTPRERVELVMQQVGHEFLDRWRADQESAEMKTYIGRYDGSGTKL